MPSLKPLPCPFALFYEGQHRLCTLPAGHKDQHHRDQRGLEWDRYWEDRVQIYDQMCASAGWRETPPEQDAWTKALYKEAAREQGLAFEELVLTSVRAEVINVTYTMVKPPRTRAERKKGKR